MKSVNMDAKSSLSRLIREVREGSEREIIICVSGQPAAKLVPIAEHPRRQLGVDRGGLQSQQTLMRLARRKLRYSKKT